MKRFVRIIPTSKTYSFEQMNILGLSAYYHDSAAALLQDGQIVAAAQEERFSRKKHDAGFPGQALSYCLAEGGLDVGDLDLVVFYEKPLLRFERLLETYIAYAPRGFRQFRLSLPLWLKQKLHLPRHMDKALGGRYPGRYVFLEHHEAHAASAFFPSPYEEAAILTFDGVGEWATASFGTGRGNRIELSHVLNFPHSLGLLYSAFTSYTGFRVNSGEYKLMGLAPYGEPRYTDLIREKLIDIKDDGSFRLNMDYFSYGYGTVMVNRKFEALFGRPARRPESPISELDRDVAASIQQVTEEVMLKAACHLHAVTGMKHLVLAGGVALNCVGNGRILRESPFDELWIQPAAGDAGGALGAALFTWHQLLDKERPCHGQDRQQGSLLGPAFSQDEIVAYLDSIDAVYHRYATEEDVHAGVAQQIKAGKVIGLFQGRMEFGPRGLGNRSILGDARDPDMPATLNLKVKFRESFRPFAPSVLAEDASDMFGLAPDQESPYMLVVAPVQEDQRGRLPAVTHVDHSARVQTVDAKRNRRLHGIMTAFKEMTGCPVIINTSFNVAGEPIVCRPQEAYHCFRTTAMDVLVLENLVLFKTEQPDRAVDAVKKDNASCETGRTSAPWH